MFENGFFFNQICGYLDFVKERKVAIWGMGNMGSSLKYEMETLSSWKNFKHRVEYFDLKKNEYKNVDTLNGKSKDYYVLVCFKCGFETTKIQLRSMGYIEIKDYLCLGEFFQINNLQFPIPHYVYKDNDKKIPLNSNPRLLILGNGPSLNMAVEIGKSFFCVNDCMCVNEMVVDDLYETIKPKYYVLADPAYWADEYEYDLLVGHDNIESVKQEINDVFQLLINKTKWDMYVFFPYPTKKLNAWLSTNQLEKNSHLKIVYVYSYVYDGIDKYNLYDRGVAMPRWQNVLIFALMTGIRLNYQEIDLFGADHSWTRNLLCDNNGLYLYNHHFYKKDTSKSYIKCLTTCEYFKCLTLMFKGYEEIQSYAKYKNIKIYNMTSGSFIDAFERKDVRDILTQ